MLPKTIKLLRTTVLRQHTPPQWLTHAQIEMRHQLVIRGTFGVFVTLKRSAKQTRYRFPRVEPAELKHLCVQACLGYWDASYKPITDGPFLVNKLVHLVQSFEHSDSRYKHFESYPLHEDSGATLELTLMQQPLAPIDHQGMVLSTHTPFSNNTHGCIIVAPFGTSTFLPNVFPDTPFATIRDHLIAKASNGNVTRHNQLTASDRKATAYYSYSTTVVERRVNVYTKTTNHKRKYACHTRKTSKKPRTRERRSKTKPCSVPTLLIPHAGKVYAGNARKRAFQCVPNPQLIRRIDYIATVHNPIHSPSKDHSYEWVKDELRAYFPNATHYVHYPTTWVQSDVLAKSLSASGDKQRLIIGTTDLMHYGQQYNYTPVHSTNLNMWKKKQEKPLLDVLQNVTPQRLQKMYQSNPHIMCGPFATYAVLQFLVFNGYKKQGKCVAYYDSADVHAEVHASPDTFVSYVSFVYS